MPRHPVLSISILLLALLVAHASASAAEEPVTIVLRSGEKVEGVLVDFAQGRPYRVKLPGGAVREVLEKDVARIELAADAPIRWDDAQFTQTSHFLIRSNAPRDAVKRYADRVEKLYALEMGVLGLPRVAPNPSHVWIFAERAESDVLIGEPGIGGYYAPVRRGEAIPDHVVVATHEPLGTRPDARDVLTHLCARQVQHALFAGAGEHYLLAPPWWTEGGATYFGDGLHIDATGMALVRPSRLHLAEVKRMIDRGGAPGGEGLSGVVRASPQRLYMNPAESVPLAWSLTYYLLHRGKDAAGVERAQKIAGKQVSFQAAFHAASKAIVALPPAGLEGAALREHYAQALEGALGMGLDELTDDWRAFFRALPVPAAGDVKGRTFDAPEIGLRLEWPEGFAPKHDPSTPGEVLRLESGATRVRIEIEPNPGARSVGAVCEELEKVLAARDAGLTVERHEQTMVADFPAARLAYRWGEGGDLVRHVLVVGTQRVLHLVGEGLGADAADFEKIVASVKLEGGAR